MTAKPLLPQQTVTMKGDAPSRDLVEVIQRIVDDLGAAASAGDLTALDARVDAVEAELSGSMIVPQTAVAASSQTSIDFTGIPAWVNRINVMWAALSSNGTSQKVIRIGDGAIVATGYSGGKAAIGAAAVAGASEATGFGVFSTLAADTLSGKIMIDRFEANTWIASGVLAGTSGNFATITGGSITLSSALDRVRVTTLNGTDTFDAGSVNISWE